LKQCGSILLNIYDGLKFSVFK